MTYKWTFMVYMAGDNGKMFDDGMQLMDKLEGYGWRNIEEMSQVGSTTQVAVVVQYDTLTEHQHTPRLYIDQSSPHGRLIETLPPVNTGDPQNLTDFIVWAMSNYQAERYALILWGHGNGWREENIYARYQDAIRDERTRGTRGQRKRFLRRALFLPTASQILSIKDDELRGICFDDSSMDFLDNRDLAQALNEAEKQTRQRLSILGMDACLMGMIEVAYQVHEYAEYMVGSQEVELAHGWPYKDILAALVETPTMSGFELSQLIVHQFKKYYTRLYRDGGGRNTQSAIDLATIPQTFAKIKTFAELVAEVYDTDFKTEIALTRVRHEAESFQDEDYVDLRHLMELLRNKYEGDLEVADLANELMEHLTKGTPGSPIVENFCGRGRPNANGLSIYFPPKNCSPFYDKQAFALSGWSRVIRRANYLKAPVISAVKQPEIEGEQTNRAISTIQITCPICEGQTEVPTNIADVGLTIATKRVHNLLTQIISIIQQALASPTTEANQWTDLPCPHCQHTFLYNIQTGETRR